MSSDDIYTLYNIDKSKLKRDYVQFPLKRRCGRNIGECPNKEDIEYLYIEINLSRKEVATFFNMSEGVLKKIMTKLGIKKPRHLSLLHHYKTCEELYSNKVYTNREKCRKTTLENHGVDFYMKHNSFIQKSRETCKKIYGKESFSKTKEYIKRTMETNNKKYGTDFYLQSTQYKKLWKNEEFKNSFLTKVHNTKKKNGSYRYSVEENQVYEMLCEKFTMVERQYCSDLYPYRCDFYIPSLDLYIEYQGFWMHGKKPYIGNEEQKDIVKIWSEKNTSQYAKAMEFWTVKDVEKRNCAKTNNLNWMEFFNMTEFKEWYDKQ